MVKIKDYTGSLFEEQKRKSALCTLDNIEKLVNIYNEALELDNMKFQEKIEIYPNNINKKLRSYVKKRKTDSYRYRKRPFHKDYDLKTKHNLAYYDQISMEIVLDEKYNPRWNKTGINRIFDDKIPSFCDTPKTPFYKIFPENRMFEICSDDGNSYKAKLTGMNKRDLILMDGNIYEYVKTRINLKEYRPITHWDLTIAGVTRVYFEKYNKEEYYMYLGD